MKTVYITYLYDIQNKERFEEIKSVLLKNINNSFIDETIIFFQNYKDVSKDKYKFLNEILVIDTPNRQNYKDIIDYVNKYCIDKYVIISNTDILFDKTIERIKEIEFNEKKLCALTRWNQISPEFHKLELQFHKNVAWSFDTYIFKSPLKCDVNTIDICVGLGGCDTLLLKRLAYENLIDIINPCLDIRTFHIDPPNRIRHDTASYFNSDDYPWQNNVKINEKPHTLNILDGIEATFINSKININSYDIVINQILFMS